MLPQPHGGKLVGHIFSDLERQRREDELRDLPQLTPSIDHTYDTEKLAIGAYSPLDGFVDEATYRSILERTRLPNGLPWSIPIVLTPTGKSNLATLGKLRPGEDVALLEPKGQFFALLRVDEIYPFDRKAMAQSVYGTTDAKHPNVADLMVTGDTAISGRVSLLHRLDSPHRRFELTPTETRDVFRARGWKNVAAYQTRNVPHLAHEYLQRCTLERDDVDGLLVHPVVGRLKKGDYKPEIIVEAYERMIESTYPADRVLLASLTITMPYAGPKAALFLAIVRKNYGCGLYIVGRDQAGVGTFYEPFACQRIFDDFPIDVVPVRYQETFYCSECAWMATPKTCKHPASSHVDTSQTRIRRALAGGEPLPKAILRPEIVDILTRGDVLLTE
ncbi:MAG: sulfate adenylyltransferase [Thermoplasmata archaeon]